MDPKITELQRALRSDPENDTLRQRFATLLDRSGQSIDAELVLSKLYFETLADRQWQQTLSQFKILNKIPKPRPQALRLCSSDDDQLLASLHKSPRFFLLEIHKLNDNSTLLSQPLQYPAHFHFQGTQLLLQSESKMYSWTPSQTQLYPQKSLHNATLLDSFKNQFLILQDDTLKLWPSQTLLLYIPENTRTQYFPQSKALLLLDPKRAQIYSLQLNKKFTLPTNPHSLLNVYKDTLLLQHDQQIQVHSLRSTHTTKTLPLNASSVSHSSFKNSKRLRLLHNNVPRLLDLESLSFIVTQKHGVGLPSKKPNHTQNWHPYANVSAFTKESHPPRLELRNTNGFSILQCQNQQFHSFSKNGKLLFTRQYNKSKLSRWTVWGT